ncbi:unnamed protein product, partial [Durusdinium trenchii]
VASVVVAWETSKEFIAKEVELRAESKVMGQPRVLQVHERQAMIRAVEAVHGALNEAESPSQDYLSLKADETECNEPVAAQLDEILSKKESSNASIQSSVDPSGHLRVTRTKVKAKMPTTTEEYRRVMKVEMFAWLCMAARFRSKHWLHGLTAEPFLKFVDFILGDRVWGIQVPSQAGESQRLKPDWAIVLAFEYKLRKEAMKLVTNSGHTLADALAAVIRDPDLKEAYFTTPIALKAATSQESAPPNKWLRLTDKGFPWLSNSNKGIVDEANQFVLKCLDMCHEAFAAQGHFILEHPEDLGIVQGERPGSIWQWPELHELLTVCSDPKDAGIVDEGQPFYLRALSQWLKVFEDPDVHWLVDESDSFASGVPLGVEEPLPRSPQVFPPKVRHRKLDETEFNPLAVNYPSGQLSRKELEEKFREEESLGRMFPSKLSVLRTKYGEHRVRVAAMAAIAKPDGSVRPLHDATHSVKVNHSIVYQDQIQCPGPAEIAAVVREAFESREAPFCVSADIKAAHRLVKIREEDWGYTCCRADSASDVVWVNRTGTFGVSSAPYWWAKLCGLIGRFVGHLMQTSLFLHMIYVDDLHGVFLGERKFLDLWIWLLAFELAGTPFGYHKFKGGVASEFVGFNLRYDLTEVGISDKRGQWLIRWIVNAKDNRWVVPARDFSEFLGRLCFVAQLLVWLKPHLAPLFAWTAVVGPGTVGRLPEAVILTLHYILAELVSESFRVSAKAPVCHTREAFRTDAKCTDTFVVLGGWELGSRRWFSLKLTKHDVPYLFREGGGSQWASTSAELLGTLAALHAFGWLVPADVRRSTVVSLSAGTDNQANESLSIKRSSTKWPLMAINMQLSASLSKARLGLRLRWRPRDENEEADDLTNEVFGSFSESLRVPLTLQDLDLKILSLLVETREAFDVARAKAKADKGSGK